MSEPLPRASLAARVAALCLRLYQLTLSPALHALFGSSCGCRFSPTCSCYAREAMLKHGFFLGCGLALRRILRCHPWTSGGYDPVPDLQHEKSQDTAPTLKTHLDG